MSLDSQSPLRTPYVGARSIQWLILGRFVVLALLLVSLRLFQLGRDELIDPPTTLAILLFGANLFYFALQRYFGPNLYPFAALQLALDLLFASLLAYMTGGFHNVFTFVFFFPIIGAALLVSPRTSLLFASLSTVALALIQITYVLSADLSISRELPLVAQELLELDRLRWNEIAGGIVAHGLAFHVTAALAGLLTSEALRMKLLYEEILEDMAEGLIAIDHRNRVVFVNENAKRLLSFSAREAILGRPLMDVFRRSEDKRILEALLEARTERYEMDVTMRNGARRLIEVSTSVIRGPDDQIRGVVGVFTDLTMWRRLEEAEERARRLRELEDIALAIAHEIRNPLASIRGGIQELGRESTADPDRFRLTQIICRESDRLDRIITEFLNFSRTRPRQAVAYNLVTLVEEVVLLLQQRPDSEGVKIYFEPRAPEVHPRLRGDPDQVRQVLLNLGINALEAMKGSGQLVFGLRLAEFSSRRQEHGGRHRLELLEGAELTVRDNGPGIPPDETDRVFSPFFTTKASGTGIGLSLANKIVKAHGGHLFVSSVVGEGSVFTVWLPLPPEAADAATPRPLGEGRRRTLSS